MSSNNNLEAPTRSSATAADNNRTHNTMMEEAGSPEITGAQSESYQELLSDEVSLVTKMPSVRLRRRRSSSTTNPRSRDEAPASPPSGRRPSLIGWPRRGSSREETVREDHAMEEFGSRGHAKEEKTRAEAGTTSTSVEPIAETTLTPTDEQDALLRIERRNQTNRQASQLAKAEDVIGREAGHSSHHHHLHLPRPPVKGIVERLAKRHRKKNEARAEIRRQKRMQRWAALDGGSRGDEDLEAQGPNSQAQARVDHSGLSTPASEASQDTYAAEVVDVLDVVDPAVSTVGHLANIGNSIVYPYIPSLYNRRPVIDIPGDNVVEELEAVAAADRPEEKTALDQHVHELLTNRQKAKRIAKGVLAYLCTWQGAIVGIYGFLVVFWGAALVIFLAGWINHGKNKDFWVEVCSQILNALFTITGVGLIPWRLRDSWWMIVICHYQHLTWRLRREEGLSPLKDPNELPAGPGQVKAPATSSQVSLSTLDTTEAHQTGTDKEKSGGNNEDEDEVQVLSISQAARLHRVQALFAASAPWYRPHETATHRAFPISWALMITLFNVGNSIFQVLLCITMWYFAGFSGDPPRYKDRPSYQTACGIAFSFSCGIAAAILIWRGGERTKRRQEVEKKLERALEKAEM